MGTGICRCTSKLYFETIHISYRCVFIIDIGKDITAFVLLFADDTSLNYR